MSGLYLYTVVHVVISLAALGTGIPLLLAWRSGKAQPRLATVTIVLLVLTTLTGFGFPFVKFLPSHAFGILSSILLGVTVYARWVKYLAGSWRTAYAATLALALYLDAFVALAQSFLRIPALHALAPSEQSPGFVIGQSLLLVTFLAIGSLAVRGFRWAV